MSVVVFLGPSLDKSKAKEILDAHYLPPVKMGDVYAAVQRKPRAIVIIDGLFEQTPAVWHKEILYAIDQGIKVYGGASMGALRATELQAFGMLGVGRIFSAYSSGELEDDDEVAITHSFSDGVYSFRSEAMVNIRFAIQSAISQGVIAEATGDRLTAIGKAMFYPDRNWQALLSYAKKESINSIELEKFNVFLDDQQPDQKRDDAIQVLRQVGLEMADISPAKKTNDFVFEHTVFWEYLVTYCGRAGISDEHQVSNDRVRNHVRLTFADRDSVRQRALLLFFVLEEARRTGLEVTDDRAALQHFRYKRGLLTQGELLAWLAEKQMTREQCLEIARLEVLMLRMEQRYAEQIDRQLRPVLLADGKYSETISKVSKKWKRVEQTGSMHITEDLIESRDKVLDWYQNKHSKVHQHLDEHIAELGFTSMRQFLNELYAEYLDVHDS